MAVHKSPRPPQPFVIAVDTGGTFTDCIWIENGDIRMLKVFSTPDDPSRAIAEAVRKILPSGSTVRLLHGTTVGTNALLQRKGARVAFVTTAGFEDTIEIGRQARPKLYDLFFDKVAPLVPAEMRFGARERVGSDSNVVIALGPDECRSLMSRIAAAAPDAIAVSLLFSFANPEHEQQLAKSLQELDVPLSLSHELLPEFREYERASTVCVNAYLQPVMGKYLRSLANSLEDGASRARVFVMQSSGGITALESAAREPVRTVLSGPAGGVVGALAMARRSGYERIISFDMGGTSTDVALVDGDIRATNEAEIAGLPVRVPMLDIHTVGAGGGSIARFDTGGALRVGPESAGADPGPICYGKGEQPTVTDANLLLGRLRLEAFLGGDFELDLVRTQSIVTHWLRAKKSDLSIEDFATGVLRVVNAAMEKAIRVVSIERGYDPRDFSLVAFGGAGGLHACELASALGIPRVMIPAFPGALSAYGILVSDVVKDYSRTVLTRIAPQSSATLPADFVRQIEGEFRLLEKRALHDFNAEHWIGNPRIDRSVDIRYHGQGFELNIPWSSKAPAQFAAEHKRRYGYADETRDLELVTVRLRARISSELPRMRPVSRAGKGDPATAQVWFDRKRKSTVYRRELLKVGKSYFGPAIVTEYSATTVVPPGMTFNMTAEGNLVIDTSRK